MMESLLARKEDRKLKPNKYFLSIPDPFEPKSTLFSIAANPTQNDKIELQTFLIWRGLSQCPPICKWKTQDFWGFFREWASTELWI